MGVFIESGYTSLNKFGEELCGDRVESFYHDDIMTIVLADGLGSGVKANILSTLTSKIIGTMMSNNMKVEDCVETIVETLPICSERQVAYSTFTILQVSKSGEAYLVQFDNPSVVYLRNGKSLNYHIDSKEMSGKIIHESRFTVENGDVFVLFSDGVIHAGVGMLLNFGWQQENVVKFLEDNYNKDYSAKRVAAMLAEACNNLYMEKPGDDTTVAALKVRRVDEVSLIIGPPVDCKEDETIAREFMGKTGRHIVCGGTTSKVIGDYLGEDVKIELVYADPSIPPVGHMRGVDLVTEGVLTMGKVVELAQLYNMEDNIDSSWIKKKDAAAQIAKILFEEATDINLFVGRAINPAHQNPKLPIDLSIKLKLVKDLAKSLNIMGKRVTLKYF